MRGRDGICSSLRLTLLVASLVSCSPVGPPAFPNPEKIVLYEGLPHPLYEPEKLTEE